MYYTTTIKEITAMDNLKEIFPFTWTQISRVTINNGKISADVGAEVVSYSPFDSYSAEHSIFEEFISVNINSHTSIIEFIQNYGFLTLNVTNGSSYRDIDTGEIVQHYELIDDFVVEYKRCKQISDLYVLCYKKEHASGEVIQKIESLESKLLCPASSIRRDMILSNTTNQDWINDNLAFYSMNIVAQQVNEQTKNVSNMITVKRDTLEYVENRFASSLLSMIYEMFSLRIASKKILRICKNVYCDKSFFILKNDKRKLYCSRKCATQQSLHNYREKNKDAINAKRRAKRKLDK